MYMNVRMGMCARWVGVFRQLSAIVVVPPTQAPENFTGQLEMSGPMLMSIESCLNVVAFQLSTLYANSKIPGLNVIAFQILSSVTRRRRVVAILRRPFA